MKNTMDVHARNFGSKISFLDVNLPIESEASFLKTYVQKLEDLQNVDFVIIDHISSASALVFPIKKMIDECKNRGITVLIDGAHAPGQLNLNLNELGADFYVGNLHKWCYAGTIFTFRNGASLLGTIYIREETNVPKRFTGLHFYGIEE